MVIKEPNMYISAHRYTYNAPTKSTKYIMLLQKGPKDVYNVPENIEKVGKEKYLRSKLST